jgi:tRNA(Ile)-lysidine synthase
VGPHPDVAACRTAVRHALVDLVVDLEPAPGAHRPRRPLVLVAVSGGPDSTALLQAACFVGPRLGLRVGAVSVDHGLQPGSAERARQVARYAASLGADPVSAWHVQVQGPGGPEAAARRARHAVYAAAAHASGAAAVLLGHTLDDQAETVLLGLARGSGPRSLAGMAGRAGLLRRPLLALPRATVHRAVRAADPAAAVWHDPHNSDPAFTRARVRAIVLPLLEAELGPGVAAALARTADLARADADALDEWAAAEQGRHPRQPGDLDAVGLSALPAAVRTRVLRRAALAAGCPASDLSARHVLALDVLVRQGAQGAAADLPGGVRARREGDRLLLDRPVRRR